MAGPSTLFYKKFSALTRCYSQGRGRSLKTGDRTATIWHGCSTRILLKQSISGGATYKASPLLLHCCSTGWAVPLTTSFQSRNRWPRKKGRDLPRLLPEGYEAADRWSYRVSRSRLRRRRRCVSLLASILSR